MIKRGGCGRGTRREAVLLMKWLLELGLSCSFTLLLSDQFAVANLILFWFKSTFYTFSKFTI